MCSIFKCKLSLPRFPSLCLTCVLICVLMCPYMHPCMCLYLCPYMCFYMHPYMHPYMCPYMCLICILTLSPRSLPSHSISADSSVSFVSAALHTHTPPPLLTHPRPLSSLCPPHCRAQPLAYCRKESSAAQQQGGGGDTQAGRGSYWARHLPRRGLAIYYLLYYGSA